MCKKLLEVVDQQLADQLPGGKYWQPSSELLEQTRSCHATDISGERVFGRVDAALKKAPNVSTEKVEAKVMFGTNQTGSWLAAKLDSEKSEALRRVRGEGRALLGVEKQRKLEYKAKVQEKLRCKTVALTQKEEKNRDVTEKLIDEVLDLVEDIDDKLEGKSVTRQKLALRVQAKALTKVVGIHVD